MDGIINVYKEAGYTSFDVVAKLRGILKQKKIGHTGTLDPDAEGVLPVCVGKATKACAYLMEQEKVYQAVLRLGVTTDTQDMSGRVLREEEPAISDEALCDIIQGFVGRQTQVPPMYSALKVNGRKLCDLARAGIEVERKAREITIRSIRVLSMALPLVTMEVRCSKGTYIRTLCHDIGERAGCGGCMDRLVRRQTAGFKAEDAWRLEEIAAVMNGTDALGRTREQLFLPVDEALLHYPKAVAQRGMEKSLQNGAPLPIERIDGDADAAAGLCRMYDADGRFVGLFRYDAKRKAYRPEKMFL